MDKIFKYKSMCHTARMYSTKVLIIGDVYDVYITDYAFSDEYEIFKDDVYYTSFHLDLRDIHKDNDKNFLKYFYNEQQMKQINREDKINKLGIW